jgi:hypothetical protein
VEKIKFFNKQKKVLMLLFFVLFLKNFSFAAFSLEYSMNNSQYQSQTQDTNSIFGNFSDVAILKVSSDPANNLGPQWNQMPTVFGLDNGYNRIVWNALDPTDSSWTFHTAQFKFNNPMGIATNGNNKVIVADTYNNRLVEFTIQIGSDGIDLVNPSIIGCQGIKPGQFNHPYGVCYDGVGNIWVADTNNYRIQSLFPNGAPRSMINMSGSIIFNTITGIAVSYYDLGTIYVCDIGQNSIIKLDNNGNYLTQTPANIQNRYYKIDIDKDNNVYATASGNGTNDFVYVIDSKLDSITSSTAIDVASNGTGIGVCNTEVNGVWETLGKAATAGNDKLSLYSVGVAINEFFAPARYIWINPNTELFYPPGNNIRLSTTSPGGNFVIYDYSNIDITNPLQQSITITSTTGGTSYFNYLPFKSNGTVYDNGLHTLVMQLTQTDYIPYSTTALCNTTVFYDTTPPTIKSVTFDTSASMFLNGILNVTTGTNFYFNGGNDLEDSGNTGSGIESYQYQIGSDSNGWSGWRNVSTTNPQFTLNSTDNSYATSKGYFYMQYRAIDNVYNTSNAYTLNYKVIIGSVLTYTPSCTYTSTPTYTPTITITNTITSTITPTFTSTFTPTFSLTFTPTFTYSRTITPTYTPTGTFSNTVTSTFTVTKTSTPTATGTNTGAATSTITKTGTITPTGTKTNTFTVSPTFTKTGTITTTGTKTNTFTFSPTVTKTFTLSPTNTGTRTITPTVTKTNTSVLTSTITISFTATVTKTITATFTKTFSATSTITLTRTKTITLTATPTITKTGTITPTGTKTNTFTISPTVTKTFTITPTGTKANTLTASPTGTRSFTVTSTVSRSATYTTTSTATNTQTMTFTTTLTFSPTSTYTLTNAPSSTDTQTLTPTVTLTGTTTSTPTYTVTQTATPNNDLGMAVDCPSLSWYTGGYADWTVSTVTTYYNGSAAQSGTIYDSQSSYMYTMVNFSGYKTLSFYWKVSSEASYDYLTFYIDGQEADSISGNVDWDQDTFLLAPGQHTLEWEYAKDESISELQDTGWVDDVQFIDITPTFTPTITQTFTATQTGTITQTVTITQTLTLTPAVSPTNTGTITMTYSSTPTYTTTQYVSPTATVTNTILLTITPTVTPTSTPVLDIYEPDDNFSMAQQILSGVEQTHSIMPAGDIDCVMFNVTTTSNVTLETSGTSESDDTVMELYSFNSVSGLYSFITDDDDGGNYLYSKITTILNPGTYYAMVYDYNTEDTITQYYLDLTVNILPTPTCTNTISMTSTITITPSLTATQTYTATLTNTPTTTFTVTPTVTQTSTFTPTQTATPTKSNTITQTSTPTSTATIYITFTSTLTATQTPSRNFFSILSAKCEGVVYNFQPFA